MMHGPEKSDSVGVAVKPMNKAEQSVAELVEPRTGTKGNAGQQSTRRAQDRGSVSQALDRVWQAARQRKKEQFTSLLHHVDPAMLRTAFYATKRDAAPGVDGMTWETYERDLDRQIETLHERVKSGAYRALPPRRSYIPKEDGSKRPLAVAALEDKIVQRAVAALLSAIHEEDFLVFSYRFRPQRSQHDALDALIVGISSKKVNFILDADIRSFFTEVSQEWVVRFLEHRIGAKSILRILQQRLRAVSLTLHRDKTRLIECGRFAAQNRERRGLGKPETFKFLGFVFISGKSRRGDFQIRRKSCGDRMRAKLRETKEALRERRHEPIPEVGKWLAQI